MKNIDDVIIMAIQECRMAPIISMMVIAGSSVIILIVNLIFLVPLSKKMTNMAYTLFQFDVNPSNQAQPSFGRISSVPKVCQ